MIKRELAKTAKQKRCPIMQMMEKNVFLVIPTKMFPKKRDVFFVKSE